MPIQVLPEQVIAKIAAGEVVERPASVVKELVENAIDAGARTINVESEGGGRRLMRISDDGCGIPAAEVELALARHATSKLQSAEDLLHIGTLGFRGEALATIAAVSKFTLTTRTRDETTGVTMRVHGGEIVSRSAAGAPAGTVITVENLFYNVPARLKFLKKETTERRHIDDIVTRYAMAYPDIRFSLHQGGRERFRAGGSGALGDVLVEVLGLDDFKQMLEVSPQAGRADLPPIQVGGYTSATTLSRASRSHITLFVNGRHVRDNSLAHAVVQSYHGLLPGGRYPVAVLMVSLPTEEVDVNVHPTKAEVRFSQPGAVFAAVQRAVRAAVVGQEPAPSQATSGAKSSWSGSPAARRAPLRVLPPQPELGLPVSSPFPSPAGPDALPALPFAAPEPAPRRTLPMLRVVGQIGATYIVAEGPAGLYLVDQHAAHWRILFEQLMAERAASGVKQQALEGVTVELQRREVTLVEENLDHFASVGLALEPFGGSTYLVSAVPSLLAEGDPAEVLRLILADWQAPGAFSDSDDPDARAVQVAARVCQVAAVKPGHALGQGEMQTLVRQLEHCANPKTCPDQREERATLIQITSEQLAEEFRQR